MWKLHLKDKDYTIELLTSKLSGKKKLLVNGQNYYETKK